MSSFDEQLGNIIVENRTGGDGLIGIKAVKGANSDGTTILVTTGPTMYLLPNRS
jgi:tripartite-type tricarboxylate transporter receptor subunit TctC